MALERKHVAWGGIAALVGALMSYQWFNQDFAPHAAAFAAQQKADQLEQYIALQQEYNRQLMQQQQAWQQYQMQQQYYQQPRPYDGFNFEREQDERSRPERARDPYYPTGR